MKEYPIHVICATNSLFLLSMVSSMLNNGNCVIVHCSSEKGALDLQNKITKANLNANFLQIKIAHVKDIQSLSDSFSDSVGKTYGAIIGVTGGHTDYDLENFVKYFNQTKEILPKSVDRILNVTVACFVSGNPLLITAKINNVLAPEIRKTWDKLAQKQTGIFCFNGIIKEVGLSVANASAKMINEHRLVGG